MSDKGDRNRFQRMMAHAMRSLSLVLSYMRAVSGNALCALFGASAWAVIWFVAFYFANAVTRYVEHGTSGGSSSSVTFAFGLTISVIAGHAARIAAFGLGCDTDFKTIIRRSNRHEKTRPIRLGVGIAMFVAAMYALVTHEGSKGLEKVDVFSWKFVVLSAEFWLTILCLFGAQCAFSWPDSVTKARAITRLSN